MGTEQVCINSTKEEPETSQQMFTLLAQLEYSRQKIFSNIYYLAEYVAKILLNI